MADYGARRASILRPQPLTSHQAAAQDRAPAQGRGWFLAATGKLACMWRVSRRLPGTGAALAGEASAAAADVERAPPVPDLTAGAFFDVDNTLMQGASIYHFARGLAARKMFGPRDLARMTWGQLYFRLRGAENSDHIDAARQAALAFVARHSVADIVRLGQEIYHDTMADLMWEGARELTQRHLNAAQRG